MSLKLEQVLQIEPQTELKFIGPFNLPVNSYIKLTNPSEKKVMYKIKTTAPKKYCVRPNSGLLLPGETAQIAICLQPFLYDPAEKNKHKFMVQSVFAPETGEYPVFDTLWKEISPDQLMDSKLKCVFEMPQQQDNQNSSGEAQRATVHTDETLKIGGLQDGHAGDAVELQKATKEIQRLREIESELRQTILRLKEDKLELINQKGIAAPNRYAPPVEQQNPMYLVGIAIAVGLLGLVLGKLLL